ncbi:MAG: pullulanase-type alpha-1,6-glucosidase [Propionibacteriaceae bacterium]|nr:pullulanase-type alpha-1,6-glucosidase [Propionibacteriaceae bacterium]
MNTQDYPGLDGLKAKWIDRGTILWPRELGVSGTWHLVGSHQGGLGRHGDHVLSAETLIEVHPGRELSWGQSQAWPHLRDHLPLHLSLDRDGLDLILRGQVALAHRLPNEELSTLTGLQIGGVIDDLYSTGARLGVTWHGGVPTIRLWAPTARKVALRLLRESGRFTTQPMQRDPDGTWWIKGTPEWRDLAYNYAVTVFVPTLGRIETNIVTDPYSHALTVGSTASVLVDLADPAYQPQSWRDTPNPPAIRDVDHTIYELHVRDFSIGDQSVPPRLRGTYAAFTQSDSHGMTHLRRLAEAGMTTIHLLPTFDIASIPDERHRQFVPHIPVSAPDSAEQQAAVMLGAHNDGFNWGYDPLHYAAPEGSYATDANQHGGARVAEFRSMVASLHAIGLRVVLDQVFNHTMASGQHELSVLDKIVPGYYHRLDCCGTVEQSTCCPNIATERTMAERLMVDSVLTWAKHYRVDGFRFDLMGHHSRANMVAIRGALDKLTLDADGVDGTSIYLYGEGWNFGEVADNRMFYQAKQGQLNGTGIGTFSDRLRDAVQGGHQEAQKQGFGTGLYTDNSGYTGPAHDGHRVELGQLTDLVRLGLAGNLASFAFTASSGSVLRGDQLDYNGQPAGYASQPGEVVTYVDAHDNETLYDLLAMRLPIATSMADRIRMNTLALATCALAQTPCFWHAGTDLLRSKSLDRNSFDSGDYFNSIDWTMETSSFGRGLPPARDNGHAWEAMVPLLANPALVPQKEDIRRAHDMALDLLRLRWSTPLFRLGSAALIKERVSFPASGPDAQPGLLVMLIDDYTDADIDPNLDGVLVAFNASPHPITQRLPELYGREFELSGVQTRGVDDVVRDTAWDPISTELKVPGRTVAVLFQPLQYPA